MRYTDNDDNPTINLSGLMAKADDACAWVSKHTFERMGTPLRDEKKAEVFVEQSTSILRATTGKDIGGLMELEMRKEAETGNRKERVAKAKTLPKRIDQMQTEVAKNKCDEKDLWKAFLALLLLPFMWVANKGPFDNTEVTDLMKEEK